MVYVMGVVGFIFGFIAGQMLLYFMLRHRSREDLLNDPSLKWKYGILNWLIAGLGASSFMSMYERYFF
ncbi:MAG TPA: hypothetical protein DEA55_09160 [Rhodospirillaceae bacterium]|nr:hypothetical protein [Rhodospirillaceae bacterium]